MRKATQLTALLVVPMLSGIAAAADARWRLDLAGGALAVPSSVRPGLGKGFGFSCCEAEASRSHFESGGSYAVGVGYALTERLELTGHFHQSFPGYEPRTLGVRFATGEPTFRVPVTKADLEILSATVGARFYLLPSTWRARPWLVSQLGWYRATLELRAPLCGGPESSCTNGDGDEVDDGFGINVGGGVDLAVTRWLSLGLDLRYHNALTVLGGFDFVTTLFDVSFRF